MSTKEENKPSSISDNKSNEIQESKEKRPEYIDIKDSVKNILLHSNEEQPSFRFLFDQDKHKERKHINIIKNAFFNYVDNPSKHKINSEIFKLENEINSRIQKVVSKSDKVDDVQEAKEIEKLQETIEALNHKREIQHLLDSVSVKAHKVIESDEDFRNLFTNENEVNSFVVSVDIRRSTELMLKARTPKLFADFITTLCNDIEIIFKDCFAVVDKFTGDGILAFFPEFFSGKDAGYLALQAAKKANEAFDTRYKEFRSSFTTILRDVGLGTGVDYGKVHQVRMAGALTIVGQPVVYACRLGGAPAGKIYLNQPAYELIYENYPHLTNIEETSIEIKSEGSLICYDVQLTNKSFKFANPNWNE